MQQPPLLEENYLQDPSSLPLLPSPFHLSLDHDCLATMIKQAPPLPANMTAQHHPHGLTKLQHRLLYESDSDSSFDLAFSSPSSSGSASEYSDVASQSGSSRRSTLRGGRNVMPASSSSSTSFALESSIAIQRVLMSTNPSTKSDTLPPSSSRRSQRQSVRAIANAFEQVNRFNHVPSQRPIPSNQALPPVPAMSNSKRGAVLSTPSPLSSSSSSTQTSRRPPPLKTAPANLSHSFRFPRLSTLEEQQQHLESEHQQTPKLGSQLQFANDVNNDNNDDDDEPLFEIIPSPSRRREFGSSLLPSPSTASPYSLSVPFGIANEEVLPPTHPVDTSPALSSSSRSQTSNRNSFDSLYSDDSLHGHRRHHPFSLQLEASRSSTLSEQPFDDDQRDASTGEFWPSPLTQHDGFSETESSSSNHRKGGRTESDPPSLLPPPPKSTSICVEGEKTPTQAQLDGTTPNDSFSSPVMPDNAEFPMPPNTSNSKEPGSSRSVMHPSTSSQSQKDLLLQTERLQEEARSLLASIQALTMELEDPSSPSSTTMKEVDTTYTQIWSLMDSWYWSSFEVGNSSH